MPIRRFKVEFAVMAAAALLFAVLGPFGSFSTPFDKRLAIWLLYAVGGYAFFRPIIAAGSALSEQTGLNRTVSIALACTVAALPTTLLVAWTYAESNWNTVTVGTLAHLYPRVLLVGAVVTGCQFLLQRQAADPAPAEEKSALPETRSTEPERTPPTATQPPAANRVLDQLPPALGRELLYLENEDHYIRAHTPNGSALILMRMRDAVADLAQIDGARVHRSWWVARSAVSEVIRRDRAILLRLVDGREVPVARSAVPALRAAGWLEDTQKAQ